MHVVNMQDVFLSNSRELTHVEFYTIVS